jgi:hypothetical protein
MATRNNQNSGTNGTNGNMNNNNTANNNNNNGMMSPSAGADQTSGNVVSLNGGLHDYQENFYGAQLQFDQALGPFSPHLQAQTNASVNQIPGGPNVMGNRLPGGQSQAQFQRMGTKLSFLFFSFLFYKTNSNVFFRG